MSKIKKRIFLCIIIATITLISAIVIYFKTPRTVLKYKSDDKNILVYITEKRSYEPVPTRVKEYTIYIKKNKLLFDEDLLTQNFRFPCDGIGIDDSCVNIEWLQDSVYITITSDLNKMTFETNFS